MITPDEAKSLLQNKRSTISPDEAKRLLAGNSQSASQGSSSGLMDLTNQLGAKQNIFSRGVDKQLVDEGRGAVNLVPHTQEMLGFKPSYQPFSAQQFGEDKILPADVAASDPLAAASGQMAGAIGSMFALPGGSELKASEKIIPWLTKHLFKQAGLVGATAPVFNPDDSIGQAEAKTFEDPLTYLGIAAGPGITLGKAGIGKVKNSFDLMGGKASPEEVAQRVQAAGETKVPLGNMIDSQNLKGVQKKLNNNSFSGMDQVYEDANKSLDSRLGNVLSDLNKNPNENLAQDLTSQLVNKSIGNRQTASNLYKGVNKNADKLGLKVDTKNYKNSARSAIYQFEAHFEGNPESESTPGESKDALLSHLKEITKSPPKSFSDATARVAELNDKILDSKTRGERRIYTSLKKSLDQDIEESAKNSGNLDIWNQFKEAKEFYAKNVGPFNKGVLNKYSDPYNNADPDAIFQDFLKTGAFEKPTLLRKLTDNLDQNSIGQLAHKYLTKGKNEPLKAYDNLGDKVKDILFNPDQKKELDSIQSTKDILGKTPSASSHGVLTDLKDLLFAKPSQYLTKKMTDETRINKYLEAAARKQHPKDIKTNISPALMYQAWLSSQNGGQ